MLSRRRPPVLSSALHRPSADSMPARLNMPVVAAASIMLMPPASAAPAAPSAASRAVGREQQCATLAHPLSMLPRCLFKAKFLQSLHQWVAPSSCAAVLNPTQPGHASQLPPELVATREEEQAVSTATAGPFSPKWYATRPGHTLSTAPCAVYALTAAAHTM